MNNYYVYEWIRLDINEPFYVGKGKNDRCFTVKKRNKHFYDVLKYCKTNSVSIAIHLLDSNLTEKDALATECWYINSYVFEYGYNITNQTWGGDGGDIVSMMTPEEKIAYSIKMRKSCLGKNKGHYHSIESKNKMSISKRGMYSGKNNPMYGKNVTDYMTTKEITEWKLKISNSLTGKHHKENTKKKISKEVTRKVKGCLNEEVFMFDSVLSCKEYFEKHYQVSHRLIQKIINSTEPYSSTRGNSKKLSGLILEKFKE